MKKLFSLLLVLFLVGCNPSILSAYPAQISANGVIKTTLSPTVTPSTSNPLIATALSPTPLPITKIPTFEHIALIVLENRDYQEVLGSKAMPQLNSLAKENVLLSNYFAIQHPSLPNYIALVSGSPQKINNDCKDCFVNQPNLADSIEAAGKTWKTYQEDLPSPCFIGNSKPYYQKHNPFIYFDSIRLNSTRCEQSIVPLTQLTKDLASGQFPNFAFIMPNICNSGHDCSAQTSDQWVSALVNQLQASPSFGQNSLIIITFDEADSHNTASCCGLGQEAGGQVFTILISPLAKAGFVDPTPYSHYSLLKTILMSWNLSALGNTKQSETQPILLPWK